MRRFLAIVLLALLPLQLSWSAVASYCGHETESAGHFGHHDHAHHSDAAHDADGPAEGDAPAAEALGAAHADCSHCHGSCSVMPMVQQAAPTVAASALPRAGTGPASGAQTPDRPERPQWPPLA